MIEPEAAIERRQQENEAEVAKVIAQIDKKLTIDSDGFGKVYVETSFNTDRMHDVVAHYENSEKWRVRAQRTDGNGTFYHFEEMAAYKRRVENSPITKLRKWILGPVESYRPPHTAHLIGACFGKLALYGCGFSLVNAVIGAFMNSPVGSVPFVLMLTGASFALLCLICMMACAGLEHTNG